MASFLAGKRNTELDNKSTAGSRNMRGYKHRFNLKLVEAFNPVNAKYNLWLKHTIKRFT